MDNERLVEILTDAIERNRKARDKARQSNDKHDAVYISGQISAWKMVIRLIEPTNPIVETRES